MRPTRSGATVLEPLKKHQSERASLRLRRRLLLRELLRLLEQGPLALGPVLGLPKTEPRRLRGVEHLELDLRTLALAYVR